MVFVSFMGSDPFFASVSISEPEQPTKRSVATTTPHSAFRLFFMRKNLLVFGAVVYKVRS
jgi:hypothetical protein